MNLDEVELIFTQVIVNNLCPLLQSKLLIDITQQQGIIMNFSSISIAELKAKVISKKRLSLGFSKMGDGIGSFTLLMFNNAMDNISKLSESEQRQYYTEYLVSDKT